MKQTNSLKFLLMRSMLPRYVCQQWEEKNLWYGSLLLFIVFTNFL